MTQLPENFIYLDTLDPSIQQAIRYTTTYNFLGTPVMGYYAPRAIVTLELGQAIKLVQQVISKDGYELIVYDSYRPQKAVDHFGTWASDITDQALKHLFYPRINKADVFALGYIAKKSSHSRGSAVDLSLIPLGQKIWPLESLEIVSRQIGNDLINVVMDGSLDMGSHFDLLDNISHHDNHLIEPIFLERRNYLKAVMERHGFSSYNKEWWHYSLKSEPFPEQYFDFDIK